MTAERPSQEMPRIGHKDPDAPNNRISIPRDEIDNTGLIDSIYHSEMGHIIDIVWVGRYNNSNLRQLAFVKRYREGELTIAYEGFSVYKEKAYLDGTILLRKDSVLMPYDGSIITMIPDAFHYFNARNILEPNLNYSLDVNNTSIILNNISIYNKDHTKGTMINLRAGFDGSLKDEESGGRVNILFVSDDMHSITSK